MLRRFDHIDLRVPDLEKARAFYERFLPLLGFTVDVRIAGWIQFRTQGSEVTEFFGVTEDPHHQPNGNRIAFWAANREEVEGIARVLPTLGAQNLEGPGHESPSYYAVFFEDPFGNRFEVCHRSEN